MRIEIVPQEPMQVIKNQGLGTWEYAETTLPQCDVREGHQAPKRYKELTFRAPAGLPQQSQRLTAPKKAGLSIYPYICIYVCIYELLDRAPNICMKIHRASDIGMSIYGAPNICIYMHQYSETIQYMHAE